MYMYVLSEPGTCIDIDVATLVVFLEYARIPSLSTLIDLTLIHSLQVVVQEADVSQLLN